MSYVRNPGDPLTFAFIPSATIDPLYAVNPQATLSEARTLMELHDISQIPVLQNNRLKGIVTWETIGQALARDSDASLQACIKDECPEAQLDEDLLNVIPEVNRHGFVVVLKHDRTVSGIVTGADLGNALADVAGPYILLEKIETSMRRIVSHVRTDDNPQVFEIETRVLGGNGKFNIAVPEELTFGELKSVVCHESVWPLLPGDYDRKSLSDALHDAVELRNQLMHFREVTNRSAIPKLGQLVNILNEIERGLG